MLHQIRSDCYIKFASQLLVITFVLVIHCYGFNLDLKTARVHDMPLGEWFGYSVDIFQDDRESLLMVGAPKAQTRQPGIRRGGAVYRCRTSGPRHCSAVLFDSEGNTKVANGTEYLDIEDKSEQLFGATISVSKSGDSVLACAPNYTYFSSKFNVRDPVGTCWYAQNSFETSEEYSPCRKDGMSGYHRLGFCMAGFSAVVSESENKLFLGAPGAWYYQGAVIAQDIQTKAETLSREAGAQYDDTYLGYSMAVGDFNGDNIEDTAVAIPRGNNLTGLVALFDYDLRNILNVSGDQQGAYFGASIAVTDVDGDGDDDLIIGAPFYTKHHNRSTAGTVKSDYEVGRVSVFYQDENVWGRKAKVYKTVKNHTDKIVQNIG